jgi:hypothetical protein
MLPRFASFGLNAFGLCVRTGTPVFIDINTGGLFIPLNHSTADKAGTGAVVSGYRSS